MANPTARVASGLNHYGDDKGKWPLKNTARTYQNGQMLGVRLADGFAADFDDTVHMRFLGLVWGHNKQIDSGGADGAEHIDYVRPKRITMPLVSGTASKATDVGKAVWAATADAGKVTLSTAGLTVANLVGHVTDVIGDNPTDLTGSQVEIQPAYEQGTVSVSFTYAAPVDHAAWIADRPYIVRKITGRVRVVGSDVGAVTAEIRKAPSGTAPSAGTILHTGTLDLKGAVDTDQNLALHGTIANTIIAKGDAICMDTTGTTTAATGVVALELMPL